MLTNYILIVSLKPKSYNYTLQNLNHSQNFHTDVDYLLSQSGHAHVGENHRVSHSFSVTPPALQLQWLPHKPTYANRRGPLWWLKLRPAQLLRIRSLIASVLRYNGEVTLGCLVNIQLDLAVLNRHKQTWSPQCWIYGACSIHMNHTAMCKLK